MTERKLTKKKKREQRADLKLAIKISEQVELKEVKLLMSEFSQLPTADQGEKLFDIDRTVRVEANREKNMIVVFPSFELKGYSDIEKAKHNKPFLKIRAMFALVYEAKDLSELSDKAFDSFGHANGVYNAWPYWREFVQNVTTRMGLPSLTIPVFRIVSQPPKKALTVRRATKKKKKVKSKGKKTRIKF